MPYQGPWSKCKHSKPSSAYYQELLGYFVDSLLQRLDEAIFVGIKLACWECQSNRCYYRSVGINYRP